MPRWKRAGGIFLLMLIAAFGFSQQPAGADVVKVVTDATRWTDEGFVFALDSDGSVWAFDQRVGEPWLSRPYKMVGLNDIVDIAPFAAVRRDGKVLTWDLTPRLNFLCSETCGPLEQVGLFPPAIVVKEIAGATKIIGTTFHVMKEVLEGEERSVVGMESVPIYQVISDGRVAEYGQLQATHAISLKFIDGLENVESIGKYFALNKSGEVFDRRSNGHVGLLPGGSNIIKVIERGHIIGLNRDGHLIYWGACNYNRLDPPEDRLNGFVDDIDGIVDIIDPQNLGRNFIAIRRDGSVWDITPPDPTLRLECRTAARSHIRIHQITDLAAIPFAGEAFEEKIGPNRLRFGLGPEHTIWLKSLCNPVGCGAPGGSDELTSRAEINGKQFLQNVLFLRKETELTTGTIGIILGMSVLDDPCCRETQFAWDRNFGRHSVGGLPIGVKSGEFSILMKDASEKNGVRLRMNLFEEALCIDESLANSLLGKPDKVDLSSIRHFSKGQVPPAGLLAQSISNIYHLNDSLDLFLDFDSACASSLSVTEHRPQDWTPRNEDMRFGAVSRQSR